MPTSTSTILALIQAVATQGIVATIVDTMLEGHQATATALTIEVNEYCQYASMAHSLTDGPRYGRDPYPPRGGYDDRYQGYPPPYDVPLGRGYEQAPPMAYGASRGMDPYAFRPAASYGYPGGVPPQAYYGAPRVPEQYGYPAAGYGNYPSAVAPVSESAGQQLPASYGQAAPVSAPAASYGQQPAASYTQQGYGGYGAGY